MKEGGRVREGSQLNQMRGENGYQCGPEKRSGKEEERSRRRSEEDVQEKDAGNEWKNKKKEQSESEEAS